MSFTAHFINLDNESSTELESALLQVLDVTKINYSGKINSSFFCNLC